MSTIKTVVRADNDFTETFLDCCASQNNWTATQRFHKNVPWLLYSTWCYQPNSNTWCHQPNSNTWCCTVHDATNRTAIHYATNRTAIHDATNRTAIHDAVQDWCYRPNSDTVIFLKWCPPQKQLIIHVTIWHKHFLFVVHFSTNWTVLHPLMQVWISRLVNIHLEFSNKISPANLISVTIGQNDRHLTWGTAWIYGNILLYASGVEIKEFQIKFVEKITTHINIW